MSRTIQPEEPLPPGAGAVAGGDGHVEGGAQPGPAVLRQEAGPAVGRLPGLVLLGGVEPAGAEAARAGQHEGAQVLQVHRRARALGPPPEGLWVVLWRFLVPGPILKATKKVMKKC